MPNSLLNRKESKGCHPNRIRINFFRKSALLRLSNNEDAGSLQPSLESIPIEQEESGPPLQVVDVGRVLQHETRAFGGKSSSSAYSSSI
jgi:hypothetical protein